MKYIQKDITTVNTGVIAHGVNCQKAMGSGVALALLKKWPAIYDTYMETKPELGDCSIIVIDTFTPLFVANCYTQEYYGPGDKRYASINAIIESLKDAFDLAKNVGIDIYLPKIGAGLGGLDWKDDVEPAIAMLERSYLSVDVYICVIDENELEDNKKNE